MSYFAVAETPTSLRSGRFGASRMWRDRSIKMSIYYLVRMPKRRPEGMRGPTMYEVRLVDRPIREDVLFHVARHLGTLEAGWSWFMREGRDHKAWKSLDGQRESVPGAPAKETTRRAGPAGACHVLGLRPTAGGAPEPQVLHPGCLIAVCAAGDSQPCSAAVKGYLGQVHGRREVGQEGQVAARLPEGLGRAYAAVARRPSGRAPMLGVPRCGGARLQRQRLSPLAQVPPVCERREHDECAFGGSSRRQALMVTPDGGRGDRGRRRAVGGRNRFLRLPLRRGTCRQLHAGAVA